MATKAAVDEVCFNQERGSDTERLWRWGGGLKTECTMTGPRGKHKRSLNKPLYFRIGLSCWELSGGYPTQRWGLPRDAPAEPLESSHLARNLMSCHDVTTRSCDQVSAYTLALHPLRSQSHWQTPLLSIIQLSPWGIHMIMALNVI